MPAHKNKPDSFLKKIRITPSCWHWLGTQQPKQDGGPPYGVITIDYKRDYVHRVSFRYYFGEIPEGVVVMHKCDNTLCVNPDHLQLGTYKHNMQDAATKGRMTRGESHHAAVLTEDQVQAIRRMLMAGKSTRVVAFKFRIGLTTVKHIRNNDNWKHLPWPT